MAPEQLLDPAPPRIHQPCGFVDPLMQSLAWIAAIVLVFGPLAVRQYRKVA
jgi:hypothetical protein